MKRIRLALAAVSAILLVGGYAASQAAYFSEEAPQYAERIDRAPIVLLALVLFLAALVLGFLPGPEDEQS